MRFDLLQAYRDVRASAGRLFLYGTAIIVGIAVITFTLLLTASVESALDRESRALLGGDLALESKAAVQAPAALPEGSDSAEEVRFRSMAAFSRNGTGYGSRLVIVRGLEPAIPFYGKVVTEPENAWETIIRQRSRGALIDEGLLLQMNAEVGDTLQVAGLELPIRGVVRRSDGQGSMTAVFAPRVYVPRSLLASAFLEQRGSVVDFTRLIRLPEGTDALEVIRSIREELPDDTVEIRTVADRRERLDRINTNLSAFLFLVGFTALALGAASGAASLAVYLKSKQRTIGILKCLGVTTGAIRRIFLYQVIAVAAGAALSGSVLGIALFLLVPQILQPILPLPLEQGIRWSAVAQGAAVGVATLLLTAFPPLRRAERVSPLVVLRIDDGVEPLHKGFFLGSALLLLCSTALLAPTFRTGMFFFFGIGTALAVLFVLSTALRASARRLARSVTSLPYRQGTAALYRPNNQTTLLFMIFGLISALTGLVLTADHLIREQTSALQSGGRANLFVFDIAPDQRDEIAAEFAAEGIDIQQDVPVVLMRISSLKGVTSGDLLAQPESSNVPRWALRREFWSTYREAVATNETVTEGAWIPHADGGKEPVPVSLEDGLADRLGLGLGDELSFNVQGVVVRAVVSSIRDVHWEKLERNAQVVFPAGIFEDAPQFRFLTAHVSDTATSARVQQKIISRFPNVSVVDITEVIVGIQEILERIDSAVTVLGILLLMLAAVVLTATIVSSYGARIHEVAVLRSLGATAGTVRRCIQVEYMLLFSIAGLTGMIVSLGGGWALARFLFKVPAAYPWAMLLTMFGLLLCTALAVASFVTYPALRQPALTVLRNE